MAFLKFTLLKKGASHIDGKVVKAVFSRGPHVHFTKVASRIAVKSKVLNSGCWVHVE